MFENKRQTNWTKYQAFIFNLDKEIDISSSKEKIRRKLKNKLNKIRKI